MKSNANTIIWTTPRRTGYLKPYTLTLKVDGLLYITDAQNQQLWKSQGPPQRLVTASCVSIMTHIFRLNCFLCCWEHCFSLLKKNFFTSFIWPKQPSTSAPTPQQVPEVPMAPLPTPMPQYATKPPGTPLSSAFITPFPSPLPSVYVTPRPTPLPYVSIPGSPRTTTVVCSLLLVFLLMISDFLFYFIFFSLMHHQLHQHHRLLQFNQNHLI